MFSSRLTKSWRDLELIKHISSALVTLITVLPTSEWGYICTGSLQVYTELSLLFDCSIILQRDAGLHVQTQMSTYLSAHDLICLHACMCWSMLLSYSRNDIVLQKKWDFPCFFSVRVRDQTGKTSYLVPEANRGLQECDHHRPDVFLEKWHGPLCPHPQVQTPTDVRKTHPRLQSCIFQLKPLIVSLHGVLCRLEHTSLCTFSYSYPWANPSLVGVFKILGMRATL